MPLVFLPDAEALFTWGERPEPRVLSGLAEAGTPTAALVVTPAGSVRVEGIALPLLETLKTLAAIPHASIAGLPASVGSWALASKLAVELVARERVVPTLVRRGSGFEARWAAVLSSSDDTAKLAALARSLPPAAHAVPVTHDDPLGIWAPEALLRLYLDAVVDAWVRSTRGAPEAAGKPRGRAKPAASPHVPWDRRWRQALESPERSFDVGGFAERSVAVALERWSEPAVGTRDRLRACFRLELPEPSQQAFTLRFLLQAPDDASLMVTASEVWAAQGQALAGLGRAFRDPEEALLSALGRATLLFSPIARALANQRPESLALDAAEAWAFLGDGAAALAQAGFGVIVPAELTARGGRRLRLRMRVGSKSKVAGAVAGKASLGLDELCAVDWEAVVGDDALSLSELSELAARKAPLIRFRGTWVAVDPGELAAIRERVLAGRSELALRDALQAALAGEARQGSLAVTVAADGTFATLLEQLRQSTAAVRPPPASLQATLRPYQQRGQSWLCAMASLRLGACLADDMGLGKTVQFLCYLLQRALDEPGDTRPALLVAPTSVVGNWEREIERFAPSLVVTRHYGPGRARAASELPRAVGSLVVTTYGLLRRDAELLGGVEWSSVALDEAQNIKNAASATARAARALRASHRFALTGTPVENRLAELWSILDFANPGLLGPLEAFRRQFAVPIERYGNEAVATRLRRIVGPFILRRLKSDPSVIEDLPAKFEMKVVCTLTREQASLYKAVVDEEMRRIGETEGIERRGRVLALLTFTKQVCNHPAQYLSESGPLAGRSGKLARLTEMLEEAVLAQDKALVFTQFREMGSRLVAHLEAALGQEVLFLHGATPKATRDAMVRRFQEEAGGPRIFVLSLKAGGTGLNLTAASHVFHYDRWWNPAVEDQATDRAYRIGQKRRVQVHKLSCAGTVEEKIDALLEQKRGLAARVVGAGERWITELGTAELRELFALSPGAAVEDADDAAGAADAASTPAPAAAHRRPRARRAPRREPSR